MLTLTLIQKQLTHLVQVQNKTSLVDQKIELTLVILELQVVLVLTHTHLVELLLLSPYTHLTLPTKRIV